MLAKEPKSGLLVTARAFGRHLLAVHRRRLRNLHPSNTFAVTSDRNRTNTAEPYNPATGKWILTGSPSAFHEGGSATLLPRGEVLLADGANFSGAVTAAAGAA